MASFIKDFLSIGVSKILVIGFSLFTSIITARWLGPEGNGIIAALAVYPSVFMTFGSLGISQATTHLIGKNEFPEQSIKSSIVQIWFFTSLICIICSFILIRHFSNAGGHIILVLLAISPIPFTLFNNYNSGIFLGKNQITSYNKINWLPALVILLFMVIFLIIIPLGVQGALIAAIAGPIFMFVILLYKNKLIQAFSLTFNWSIIRPLMSLGLVYAFALLIISLNYKTNIILLDKLSNPYELGIYAKGAAIIEYLWQIPMFLSTIVFARSANAKDGTKFSYKVAQLLRLSVIAVGIGSLMMFLLARYLIYFLYGIKFADSIKVLQYLMPGVLLLTIYKVLNMDLAGKGKPWISLKAMIPALLFNIALNLFLIPVYGANGAALTSTISYSIASLLFLHFYSKEVKIPVKEILHFSRNDFKPLIFIVRNIHLYLYERFKLHKP